MTVVSFAKENISYFKESRAQTYGALKTLCDVLAKNDALRVASDKACGEALLRLLRRETESLFDGLCEMSTFLSIHDAHRRGFFENSIKQLLDNLEVLISTVSENSVDKEVDARNGTTMLSPTYIKIFAEVGNILNCMPILECIGTNRYLDEGDDSGKYALDYFKKIMACSFDEDGIDPSELSGALSCFLTFIQRFFVNEEKVPRTDECDWDEKKYTAYARRMSRIEEYTVFNADDMNSAWRSYKSLCKIADEHRGDDTLLRLNTSMYASQRFSWVEGHDLFHRAPLLEQCFTDANHIEEYAKKFICMSMDKLKGIEVPVFFFLSFLHSAHMQLLQRGGAVRHIPSDVVSDTGKHVREYGYEDATSRPVTPLDAALFVIVDKVLCKLADYRAIHPRDKVNDKYKRKTKEITDPIVRFMKCLHYVCDKVLKNASICNKLRDEGDKRVVDMNALFDPQFQKESLGHLQHVINANPFTFGKGSSLAKKINSRFSETNAVMAVR